MTDTQEFSASIYMNRAFEKAASSAATDFTTAAVHHLAVVYNFNAIEALGLLGLDAVVVKKSALRKKGEGKQKSPKVKAPKRVVPGLPLPWCGLANTEWCSGLRLNHGLHSQCTNLKQAALGAEPLGLLYEFCGTCQKQADKNSSGKPTYGTTTDRETAGILEFRCPKTGKQTLPYANVMKKLNITREKAEEEATKFGMSIPDEHFVERKTQRGRPKKDSTASDTDSAASTPKKRGRPAKVKKLVTGEVGDDLIASLVAISSQAVTVSPPAAVTESAPAVTESAPEVTVSATAAVSPTPALKVKSPKKSPEEKAARKAAIEAKVTELRAEWIALVSTRPGKANRQYLNGVMFEVSDMSYVDSAAARMTKIGDLQKAVASMKRIIKGEAKLQAAKLKEAEEKAAKLKEEEEKAAKLNEEELKEEEGYCQEEEEVEVVKFEHNGVKYLKTADNMLYFEESQEVAGMWNPESETVTPVIDEDSDEDDG